MEVLVVEVPSDEFVSSCFQGPFGREGEPGVPGTDGLSVGSTAKSPSLCLGKIYLGRYEFRPHVCQLDFEQRLSDWVCGNVIGLMEQNNHAARAAGALEHSF